MAREEHGRNLVAQRLVVELHSAVGTAAGDDPRQHAAAFEVRAPVAHDEAAHAHLSAAVADKHEVLDHKRRHGHALAGVGISELLPPDLPACPGIDGNGRVVQDVEDDLVNRG